jgi:uncharacterized membrane protein
MATASCGIEIDAPADVAWRIVGGFDNLAHWLPIIESSTLEDGGRVRRLNAIGGATIVERLLRFDEEERFYTYRHVEHSDSTTDYVAEVRVYALSEATCEVVWSSTCTPTGIEDAEAISLLQEIYGAGLAELKALAEAAAERELSLSSVH